MQKIFRRSLCAAALVCGLIVAQPEAAQAEGAPLLASCSMTIHYGADPLLIQVPPVTYYNVIGTIDTNCISAVLDLVAVPAVGQPIKCTLILPAISGSGGCTNLIGTAGFMVMGNVTVYAVASGVSAVGVPPVALAHTCQGSITGPYGFRCTSTI